MPWKIEENDGKFLVIKESDGSVAGTHASRAKAEAQLRALYASEPDADKSYAFKDGDEEGGSGGSFASNAQRRAFFGKLKEGTVGGGGSSGARDFAGEIRDAIGKDRRSKIKLTPEHISHIEKNLTGNWIAGEHSEGASSWSEYQLNVWEKGDKKRIYVNQRKAYPPGHRNNYNQSWSRMAAPTSIGHIDAHTGEITADDREHFGTIIHKHLTSGKSLMLDYIQALGLDNLPDLSVKSISADEIQGYTVLWGDPGRVDIEREFFTQETDFWDQIIGLKTPRPLTWDHALNPDTNAAPVVGKIVDMGDDELGRWYVAQLDRSHKYRKAIDRLISAGKLGTSSDSAPQYVIREKAKSGAIWLKRWPLFAAALTTTPCEPRMLGSVDYLKSIGIELPETEAAREAARGRLEIARIRHEILKLEVSNGS